MASAVELPQIEPAVNERADAARNRERILCAARRLFQERGASCVSMDEVAETAGVGKGTLFRRFGSRAALALAVLDEQERRLQDAIIRGAPPLGPGAPPQQRLIAFGEAWLDILAANSDLVGVAESGGGRFVSVPYGIRRLHLQLLLREADPGCDAPVLAEMLLGVLNAAWFIYMRDVQGASLERVKSGWGELVRRTVPATPGLAHTS